MFPHVMHCGIWILEIHLCDAHVIMTIMVYDMIWSLGSAAASLAEQWQVVLACIA